MHFNTSLVFYNQHAQILSRVATKFKFENNIKTLLQSMQQECIFHMIYTIEFILGWLLTTVAPEACKISVILRSHIQCFANIGDGIKQNIGVSMPCFSTQA